MAFFRRKHIPSNLITTRKLKSSDFSFLCFLMKKPQRASLIFIFDVGIEIVNDETQYHHCQQSHHEDTGVFDGNEDGKQSQKNTDGVHDEYRLFLTETMVDEFMVQMPPVCLHDGLMFRHTTKHGKNGIENRQTNTENTYYQRQQGIAFEHAQNTGYCQYKAQKCGACIPHEDFRGVKVTGQEAQTRPSQSRSQHHRCGGTCHDAQHHEAQGRNARYPCRQTVQTVNKVYGVGNPNDPHQRNGNT